MHEGSIKPTAAHRVETDRFSDVKSTPRLSKTTRHTVVECGYSKGIRNFRARNGKDSAKNEAKVRNINGGVNMQVGAFDVGDVAFASQPNSTMHRRTIAGGVGAQGGKSGFQMVRMIEHVVPRSNLMNSLTSQRDVDRIGLKRLERRRLNN